MMRQRIQTFEKEADAIHRFIADWQRIPTADALGRNYATLRSNMRVPEKIKIAYRKTSSILNDQSLDAVAKSAAAEGFERLLERHLDSVDPTIVRAWLNLTAMR